MKDTRTAGLSRWTNRPVLHSSHMGKSVMKRSHGLPFTKTYIHTLTSLSLADTHPPTHSPARKMDHVTDTNVYWLNQK